MVSRCVVPGCKNIGNHRFPKSKMQRRQWIQAIKHLKPVVTVSKYSYICSAHFKPNDFSQNTLEAEKENYHGLKTLKKSAIPSIFSGIHTLRDEPSTSTATEIEFDASKIHATYSRKPRVLFVEELQYYSQSDEKKSEDPLQLSDQETDAVFEFDQPDNNLVEIEISSDDCHETHDLQENEFWHHDKSVQTQDISGPLTSPEKQEKSIQTDINICGFSIHYYENDDKALHFYTGLENLNKIMLVFYSLGKSVNNLKYFYGEPPERVDSLDQFFLTLIILRRHKTFDEMTMLFKITLKNVYSIFITWIRLMALQWKNLDLWIDRDCIKAYMPLDFHDKYPATRTIIDASECPIKKPKLPSAQQITFSSYKNKNTVKFLIGIAPSGLITYVSPCYGGSATDRQIIERSSILQKFDYNDEIMVDKGLNVQDIFMPYGVKVNMPSFFKKGNQIKPGTLQANRKVASKRVHIERVIGMLKTYKILTDPMNHTETLLSSDIVFICAMLVNFRSGIINKDA